LTTESITLNFHLNQMLQNTPKIGHLQGMGIFFLLANCTFTDTQSLNTQ